MNQAIPDRYHLAADFEQQTNGISFPAEVWNVAACLADVVVPVSILELERYTGQSYLQIEEALRRLCDAHLVQRVSFSWKDYMAAREQANEEAKRAAQRQGAPSPASGAASASIGSPIKAVIATSSASAKSASDGAAARLGTIAPRQASGVSSQAWVQPATTHFSSSEPQDGRLLRPLLEKIANVKGGGVEGQLLVYQVFLEVPYQLLHDEGIKALHFVDEHTVIRNPELLAAISKAAKQVAGVNLG